MPKCPKDCKKHNPFIFRKVVIPAVVDDDTINPPANGAYCNAVVVYEATGNVYLYSSDGIPTSLSSTDYNLLSNLPSINGKVLRGDVTLSDLGISQLIEEEAELRATADEILQHQIDAITVASDVVDIVGTYEELEEYDTSKLKENDIIKVLSDETIGGATAYYRWVNGAWQYIGQEGPYYTKSQTDALLDQKMDITSLDDYYTKTETDTLLAAKASVSDLANKQDALIAGSNITIDPTTNVISATVPSLTNYYTKSETYNKTEVDNLINGVEADIPTKTSDLLNDSGFLTSIPIASSSALGGIKVGSGLSIAQDGTLSADAQHIDIDSSLSTTSINPVENRVITNALNNKANTSDIPTVPTNVSSFYNDAGYLTSTDVASNYYNKSETYTQAQVNALIPTKTSDLTNDGADGTSTYVEADDLATVATTGSYNDLTDKPSIPSSQVQSDWAQADASEVDYIKNKPTLATVATSGSYNDLSNKPTIPTVNDGTLTIQQNGTTLGTFSANQGANETINIIDSGTSYTAGSGIDITNDTISIDDSVVATQTDLGGYVTLGTNQNITGEKTFVGNKRVKFKGTASNSKLGFTTFDQNNGENGFFEVEGASTASKKVRLGCYDNAGGNARDNYVGFQYYNTKPVGGGTVSYNLVCPPRLKSISGTNSYAYIPVDFSTNGVDKVSADNSGLVNLSSIVPSKTSELVNDSGFITSYTETDPIFSASAAAGITSADISAWNDKSDFSGSYNDLTDKPTIPTVNNATLTIQRNGTDVQTFTANQSTNATADIAVPTKTSDLTNDSGYVVDDGDITCTDTEDGFAQITNPTSHNVAPTSLTHIYGNATQETTTGKNKMPMASADMADGGTRQKTFLMNLPAGTYTVSFDLDSFTLGTNTSFILALAINGAGGALVKDVTIMTINSSTSLGRYNETFTISADGTTDTNDNIRIGSTAWNNGARAKISNIQIEAGNTASNYEIYTGGSPMPNPQFPSPVETVTGAQTVKITGRNLLDIPNGSYTNNDITTVMSDNTATISGTISSSWANLMATRNKPIEAGTYTFSTNNTSSVRKTLRLIEADGTRHDYTLQPSQTSTTFTLPVNTTRYLVFIQGATVGDIFNESFTLQLEKSSTASDFEPYQAQSQEINLGKNLILFNGTGSLTNQTINYYRQHTPSINTTLEAGVTYTFSADVTIGGSVNNCILSIGNGVSSYGHDLKTTSGVTSGRVSVTFTPTASDITTYGAGFFFRFPYIAGTTTGVDYSISNVMLEKSATATDYAEYFTPIELAKIGTYQDYIWNDNGTWKIHKAIGKVVLDGTENWALYGGGGYAFYYDKSDAGFSPASTSSGAIMSDNLSPEPFSNLYTGTTDYGIALTPQNRRINIRIKGIVYVADLKTWLGTHNTTVYYALATPTDTEITDSGLIEQLNHIYSLYQGTNNLWLIPSAGAQGEMTLCASLSQLPVATTQRLGAVMVGDGLTITETGKLSISSRFYEIIIPDDVPTGTYDYDYDGGMGALVLALGREWERSSIVIKDNSGNALTPEDIEALGAENLDITFALRVPAMEGVSASGQTWDVPAFLGYFKIDSFAPAATDGGGWFMRGRCYSTDGTQYLIEIHNYEEDDVQSFSAGLYIPNAMVRP